MQITPSPGTDVSALGMCLPAAPDEHFFGLGERFAGLDLTGQVVENWIQDQAWAHGRPTSYAPTPFLLSSRGYGLLLDTTAHATFDLRTRHRGCYHIRVDAPQFQLFLIAGPHPQTVLERHARLVGLPPLPPRWAFGVWKNLIGGTARVEADVARIGADGVPIDAIWIYDAVDERAGFGWPWPIYGPIPLGSYPDLPCLIDRLQQRGFKVLGYTHPFVYPGSASFDAAQRLGLLVQDADGQPYLESWTYTRRAYVDFTNPQAVAWWQARVRFALTALGFDGAMLDFGEDAPLDGRYANGQPGALLHNQYPLLYHRAANDVAQASKPGEAVFFARAGYSGSQPYTTGRFTGDQVRSWDRQRGLPAAITAMLSGGLSGWPYWGPDIAGFFDTYAVGADEPPAARALRLAEEKELWLRWVQLGALSPTMRDMLGMQRDPVGLWTDGETLAVFRAYAQLHRALQSYLYRYAEQAHQRGLPILRPLFVNYPSEIATYRLEDEYLIGDDLLVAPILQPRQTGRQLYLPDDLWSDYWTGQRYRGPGWVTIRAPLHRIPLFIRDGAVIDLPAPHTLGLPAHASATTCRTPRIVVGFPTIHSPADIDLRRTDLQHQDAWRRMEAPMQTGDAPVSSQIPPDVYAHERAYQRGRAARRRAHRHRM